MAVGYVRALALLHRTFRRHPLSQRLHILGRFLTAPFLRTLDVIPEGSRVLDIGAGHGTYPRLIIEERAREVIAVEPDLRKTLRPYRHPKIRFVAGYTDCIRGTFDVVVVYDVLFRLSPTERDALFTGIYERVKPGGLFVLKDIDPSNRLKWTWNRLQETITDAVFHPTMGKGFFIDTPQQIRKRLERAGFTEFQARSVGAWYPHAHIIYTVRKPI